MIININLLFIRFIPSVTMTNLKSKMCSNTFLVKNVYLVLLEWV